MTGGDPAVQRCMDRAARHGSRCGVDPRDAAQDGAELALEAIARTGRAPARRDLLAGLSRRWSVSGADTRRARRSVQRQPARDECDAGATSQGAAGAISHRLWLYAALRCPQCGSRGTWEVRSPLAESHEPAAAAWAAAIEQPGVLRATVALEYEAGALRKARDAEVWVCGRPTCGHQTYEPRGCVPRSADLSRCTVIPHETRAGWGRAPAGQIRDDGDENDIGG